MLARAAGDSPSFVKLPVNHATTASGLNHHDYHSHTNKPPRRAARPHTGRYTRYVALHLLRGAAPVQNGCIAYISGALPTPTSRNADTHTSPRTGSAPPTTATHYLDRHCATYSPAQRPPSSATLPLTSPTAARVATTQGTTSTTGHCTRYVALHLLRGAAPDQNGCIAYRSGALPTDRVHCLRIGCSAHTHKPNRGEHPAARSLRPATVRTFTNSARNSLTATRNNTPETAGFQRSDFKS